MRQAAWTLVCILAIASLSATAAPSRTGWYSIGLDNQKVNCLVADDTTLILAGTDNGVMVRYGGKWLQASGTPTFKISAMARVSQGRVVALSGNGSKSDGIYLGEKIRGEPYYQFSLLCYCSTPTAVTVSGANLDSLFIGAGDRLFRCSIPSASAASVKLLEIKTPPYCFGVEMPVCMALQRYNGSLYAGGYDRSPMAGQAWLVAGVGDSLSMVKKMNVTSLATVNLSVEGLGSASLAAGTSDSGIYITDNSSPRLPPAVPWTRYDSPNKESVIQIIAVPTLIFNEELVIAVKSGIYSGSAGKWTKIGTLAVSPLYVTKFGTAATAQALVTGTEKGVYRYGELPLSILSECEEEGNGGSSLLSGSGTGNPRIFFNLGKPERLTIRLFDLTGRTVALLTKRYYSSGQHGFDLPRVGNGRYILAIQGEKGTSLSEIVQRGL
jgi:hypothetical protein